MNRSVFFRRALAPLTALALVLTLTPSASAFFWNKKADAPKMADFAKNGLIGSVISFSAEDFILQTKNKAKLNSITIDTLPDPGAGALTMGGQPIEAGSAVDVTALDGLRFQSAQSPTVMETTFTFTPTLSSGQEVGTVTVTIHLLTEENAAPVARNMDLATYKNVAITGYFDAVDGEGDTLTFQLTSTPARGAVELAEDGERGALTVRLEWQGEALEATVTL